MSDDQRMVIFQAELPVPGQSLDVEWVPDATWDTHWALVFTGVTCRQELRRLASYTEARKTADTLAGKICARTASS
jgi:hypothetical protein